MLQKRFLSFLLLFVMIFSISAMPIAAYAVEIPDWSWLVKEVASGKETILLPGNIIAEGDDGLSAEGTVRIEGGGYSITGAILDKGTFIFKDVLLAGEAGIGDGQGLPALTLRGDGVIAMLMGQTRAEGGRSGKTGEVGGDGVLMAGTKQGLILNNNTTAVGGVGSLYGGMGVRATGCGANVLITNSASLTGSAGIALGGTGLVLPSCGKATFDEQASASGGISPYTGGNGIESPLCEACQAQGLLSLGGMTMVIGGTGDDGGHGIIMQREAARSEGPDIYLSGNSMLLAGDGRTPGSALHAIGVGIAAEGTISAYGGRYFEFEAPALFLENCEMLTDAADHIAITEGTKTESYPASGASSIIITALSQVNEHEIPQPIEDGLTTRELSTKLDGYSVDKGNVSQVNVSGHSLKMYLYNSTYDKRYKFQQRLMSDGEGGVRLVLIAASSDTYPTLESTTAGLEKLDSIGITQLAYTCVAPSYRDRVLDLKTLLGAIHAYDGEIKKVICGTADDAIIFVLEGGNWDYQEELMQEVMRPVT